MITVTAAILRNASGEILICRRGAGGNCAFLWEFPGGKLEAGESEEDCVVRECQEELGITIRPTGVFQQTTYSYPDKEIAFTFFLAELVSGTPTPAVHAEIRWVLPARLKEFEFCPADVEIVERLSKWEVFCSPDPSFSARLLGPGNLRSCR